MINEIGHIGGRGDSVIDYILDEGEDILYENRDVIDSDYLPLAANQNCKSTKI